MTFLLLCILLTVVLVSVGIVVAWWTEDSLFFGIAAGLVVPALFWLVFGIAKLAMHIDESNCHKWAAQADLPVEYVRYNSFSSTCFVEWNGQWIDRELVYVNLREGQP